MNQKFICLGDNNNTIFGSFDENSIYRIGKAQMMIEYGDNYSLSISYPEVGVEEIDDKILNYVNRFKLAFTSRCRNDLMTSGEKVDKHIEYETSLESGDKLCLIFIDTVSKSNDDVVSKNEYTYLFDIATGEEIFKTDQPVYDYEFVENYAKYKSEKSDQINLMFSGDIIKFATANINVRSRKSTSSEKLGLLYEGEAIEVRESDNDWETVIYNGQEAYVKSGYLTRKKELFKKVELEVVDRGIDASKPMVALTFDDGPSPYSTPRILDTLEKYGAVATFFDLGQLMNSYPDIVRREEQIGCEIGTHTYSHKNLNTLSDKQIQEEVSKSESVFEKVLGRKPTLLRPPYGNANLKVKENIEYPLIDWNVDSLDWKLKNKEKILSRIRQTGNFDGHIILMHSIYETTADAVEVLVPELINNGYQLVTVSELAFYKGNPFIYTSMDYHGF